MAVITLLACCRDVASRVFVSTFHALGVVCRNSFMMYRRGIAVAADKVVSSA